jgi:hypothetical protein
VNNLECLNPLKKYNAPDLPTLETTRENSEILNELPHRWQGNIAVAAGSIMKDLLFQNKKMHGGGFAPSPYYVAYTTEDEIREQVK